MASSPASRPRRANRVRYREESDDDLDYRPASRSDRPSRTQNRPDTYRELSDDEDEIDVVLDLPSPIESESSHPSTRAQIHEQRKKKRRPLKRKYATRNKTKDSKFDLFKKRKPNPTNVVEPHKMIKFPLGPSGKQPQWQTLPFEALLIVMKHASYPLYGMASRATNSIEWLCGVSLLSRSFHDAAMGALLYSPPLFPIWRAHGLVTLLQRDEAGKMRNRIRRLDIEVKNLISLKNGLDMGEVLSLTPNLQHLRLYHNHDDFSATWAQAAASKGRKWSYPMEMFDKMDEIGIRLKSFEWNGRFPSSLDVLNIMSEAHSRPCFSTIESISLINVEFPEKYPEEDLAVARTLLSSSLSVLPAITSLSFRNCTLLDEVTTPLLPKGLMFLEITNNLAFLSSYLQTYLIDGGSQMTSLILKHNQSMSLEFLSKLDHITPRLRHLEIDLSYNDPSSYKDLNPLYDDALPDGPPTWPRSLVSIDIENLRQISSAEAEDFLEGLVTAGPDLIALRRIVIKAIIRAAGWRERAALRRKWIPKIDQVFLDTSVPRPIRSLPPTRTDTSDVESSQSDTEDTNGKSRGRRSGRLREVHFKRITAVHERSMSQIDDASNSEAATQQHNAHDGTVRQGRCSIVMLDISDQRPAEQQFREADFMDDEPDDDEDYKDR